MSNLDFQAGDIVSSGTLRTGDLVPAFYGALVQWSVKNGNSRFESLFRDSREWMKFDRDSSIVRNALEQSIFDEIGSNLVSDLIDALSEVAPAECYFGANEGDGACFGFWQIED